MTKIGYITTSGVQTWPVVVKLINESTNPDPNYETDGAAGLDIRASLQEGAAMIIQPGYSAIVPTGLFVEIPPQHEIQIRPRSGLAAKNSVTVCNTPGTIDSDYRGEVKVILINHGVSPFTVVNGDRIAQMVLAKHERISWEQAAELAESQRGAGGLGSTGVK